MLLLKLALIPSLYLATDVTETDWVDGWYCSKDTYYIVDWYGNFMGNNGDIHPDILHLTDSETPLMNVGKTSRDAFRFKVKKCHPSESGIRDDFYLLNVTENHPRINFSLRNVHKWYFGKSGKSMGNTVVTNADWTYALMLKQQNKTMYPSDGKEKLLENRNFYNLIWGWIVGFNGGFWGQTSDMFIESNNCWGNDGKYFTFIKVTDVDPQTPTMNISQEMDGESNPNASSASSKSSQLTALHAGSLLCLLMI